MSLVPFDTRGSLTVLTDELIGNAYPFVKHVSQNMEYVKHVSYHMETIYNLGLTFNKALAIIGDVNLVINNDDAITILYGVPLTVNRTVILPELGNSYRRIVRSAAATGNTLTIYQYDGVTPVIVLTVGKSVDIERDNVSGLWFITAVNNLS